MLLVTYGVASKSYLNSFGCAFSLILRFFVLGGGGSCGIWGFIGNSQFLRKIHTPVLVVGHANCHLARISFFICLSS